MGNKAKAKQGSTCSSYHNLPKQLRLGPFLYTVQTMSCDNADMSGVMGLCMNDMTKIHVREGLSDTMLAEVFFHEILHAIHYMFDLNDDASEESFTLLGTRGIGMFWRDNPEAVEWFNNAWKAK